MGQIKNKKKYKLTEPSGEDYVIATQNSTGKTINISVDAIASKSGGNNAPIKDIKFKGESLPVVDKTVELPSKLSEFENDLPVVEGGKIDTISFKGEVLPIVDKNVSIPSNLITEEEALEQVSKHGVKDVKNIQELRLTEGKNEGEVVRLLGYYEAGDKPELLYKWKTGSFSDDGGSIIVSNGGCWEALFNEEIDVRHFGAVDDYISSTQNTDNHQQLLNCIKYVKTITNDISGSILNNIVMRFPKSDNKSLGYACTGQLDFGYGYSVIMDADLFLTGNLDSEYFTRFGRSSEESRVIQRQQKYFLKIRKSTLDWVNRGDQVGIQLINMTEQDIVVDKVVGFGVGIKLMGINGAFSYNKIFINTSINNRIHLFCWSESPEGFSTSGYVTSCVVDINRMSNFTDVNMTNVNRYGIYIDNKEGGYSCESMTFRSGVTEVLKGENTVNLTYPVYIRRGSLNVFENFRHEANGTVFMRVDYGDYNTADLTIISGAGTRDAENLHKSNRQLLYELSPRNVANNVTARGGILKGVPRNFVPIVNVQDIGGNSIEYDNRSIFVPNAKSMYENDVVNDVLVGNVSNPPEIQGSGIIMREGSCIFYEIDVKQAKSLFLKVNDEEGSRVLVHLRAYSKGQVVQDGIKGRWTTNPRFGTGFVADTNRDGVFINTNNTTPERFITLKEEVDTLRILFTTNTGSSAVINGFTVLTNDGNLSSGLKRIGSEVKVSKVKPTKKTFIGDIVLNGNFGQNIIQWMYNGTAWIDISKYEPPVMEEGPVE